jgi:hypothetical protein
VYHGKAVSLNPNDNRVPFHGAFLIHEMRVRGRWPRRPDRTIFLSSPTAIDPRPFINPNSGRDSSFDPPDSSGRDHPAGCLGGHSGNNGDQTAVAHNSTSSSHHSSYTIQPYLSSPQDASSQHMLFPSDPFKDTALLETLKRSFAQQPNWKASMLEGQRFDGTADENVQKYKDLVTFYSD